MEGLIDHEQILEKARFLLALSAETVQDITRRNLSISETPTESRVNIFVAEKTIVSVIATIYNLSIDWENIDRSQLLRNDDKLEAPITIKRKTEYVIGNISLLCYETASITLSGKKSDISKIMEILEKNGYTPERLNSAGIKLLTTYLGSQKIRYDTKHGYLIINGTKIEFKENSIQANLLRAMFGGRGRNRKRLTIADYYDVWSNDELTQQSWFTMQKSERAKFNKRVRNTVTAINNHVAKTIGITDDLLQIRNNTCCLNPQLLKFED